MNSLNALGEDWPLVERHNRAPHALMWRELFRYSGRELSDQVFARPIADPKYQKRFVNALTLADDMIMGAEAVDDSFTASVLFYYGTLWLGNAVALSSLSGSELAKRKATHGLSMRFVPDGRAPFVEAWVDFGAPQDSFGTINEAFGGEACAGKSARISELLSALPEMREVLSDHSLPATAVEFRPEMPRGPVQEKIQATSPAVIAELIVSDTLTDGWLRDHIAAYDYLRGRELGVMKGFDGHHIAWRRAGDPERRELWRGNVDEIRALTIEYAGRHFFLPKVNRVAFSEFAIYLAVLYVIGRLARYYPDYWMTMQEDRKPEYFLIQEFLDLAEDKMPNLVLNHLSRRTNVFRST